VHADDNAATLSSKRVSTLFKDGNDRLWAGTTRGLNLVDHSSGTFVRYAHDSSDASSLGGDDITTIYEDRRRKNSRPVQNVSQTLRRSSKTMPATCGSEPSATA
jgi:hypothetical protein